MSGIDNSIYEAYGDRWYTAFDDPVALLRIESRAKLPWVLDRIERHWPATPTTDLKVLDVGCGGGFLSNALAQEGYVTTGIDLSEESLRVAERFDTTKSARYLKADAYALPFDDGGFDIVTAMDFLEHIDDPARAIREASRVLKASGLFFFHTFSRNPIAGFMVIKMVEWLVKNTPPRMHVLKFFIKPQELERFCVSSGLKVEAMTGLRPVFSSIPLKNYITGIVPDTMRFKLTDSFLLSYMGVALKQIDRS